MGNIISSPPTSVVITCSRVPTTIPVTTCLKTPLPPLTCKPQYITVTVTATAKTSQTIIVTNTNCAPTTTPTTTSTTTTSSQCPASSTLCSGSCVMLSSDVLNCGACGNACSVENGTPSCSAGTCSISCNPGFANCDGNFLNGCETAISTDPTNCGACGTVCPPAPNSISTCSSGTCTLKCNTGFADCNAVYADGCEVNINNNVQNCGTCGNACPPRPNSQPMCSGAVCTNQCNTGFAECNNNGADGCEASILTDINNCGSCGNICTFANGKAICSAGICTLTSCNPGFANCNANSMDGCETNISNNPNSCGACGRVCPMGSSCISGTCT